MAGRSSRRSPQASALVARSSKCTPGAWHGQGSDSVETRLGAGPEEPAPRHGEFMLTAARRRQTFQPAGTTDVGGVEPVVPRAAWMAALLAALVASRAALFAVFVASRLDEFWVLV